MYFKILSLFLLSIAFVSCTKQPPTDSKKEKDSLALKAAEQTEPRVQLANSLVHELSSAFTNTTYDIYISYSAHYKTSGKKYPLLVVLDAEVNFGAAKYIEEHYTM